MKYTLRPYQTNGVNLLKSSIVKHRKTITDRKPRPILCLPTGAGKTVCFSFIAEQAQRKGSKVGVVCHRKELITQAAKTMRAYGINPLGVEYGMVQTFVRSPHKIPDVDLWIIDECHIGNFRKFVDIVSPGVQIIGVTATPIGASKKQPLREVFDNVVAPVQINELIKDGYLSYPEYHIWKINESELEKDFSGDFSESSQAKVFSIDDLVDAYKRRVGKTIIFTSSISQTKEVHQILSGDYPDHTILYVHSKMKIHERDKVVNQYMKTNNATIVNCGILTAGFDDPYIETVIIYRATISVSLWLQMCGRGSRIVEDYKNKFYIMDMGNNRQRLLAWEADRDWESIFDLQGRKLKDREAPMKKCVSCEAVIYASAKKCPYCNALQPVKEKEAPKANKVEVIKAFTDLPEELRVSYSEMSVKQLIQRAAYGSPKLGRPFKIGWILSQLRDRENYPEKLQELADIKGYKKGWVLRQL